MLMNTISTLGLSKRLRTSMAGLQIGLARVTDELASGKRHDVAGSLGARAGQAISFRQMHERTDEYLKTCTLLDSRMTLMSGSMSEMDKACSDVLALALTGAEQPPSVGWGLGIAARGALDQMVGLLNATVGGRSLFSGVDVDAAAMRPIRGGDGLGPSPMDVVKGAISTVLGGPAAPATAAEAAAVIAALDDLFAVRDPATPAPPPLTQTYEGGLYTGTTALAPGGAPNPRVSGTPEEGVELAYGVQANDPMMRSLMQGLFMLAAVDTGTLPAGAYQPYMDVAIDRLSAGLGELRRVQAEIGIQHASIPDTKQRLDARMKVLNEQIIALEDVDPYETSLRLGQIEAQLEATMSATARVSRLRLTDYL
ncbi:flagellin [Arenibaculum sp.]|uniref:flagellin n=1 Tax=Arenibaculum sp. TaxID=2865862 RepID=UPI002E13CB29|nr:flagellin [Arenibaculum sp.]